MDEVKQIIQLLEEYRMKHTFYTKGAPFSKKMWREGYNKGIQDMVNYIKSEFADVQPNVDLE